MNVEDGENEGLRELLRFANDSSNRSADRIFSIAQLIVELEALAASIAVEAPADGHAVLDVGVLTDGIRQSRRIGAPHVVWEMDGERLKVREAVAAEREMAATWIEQIAHDPESIEWSRCSRDPST